MKQVHLHYPSRAYEISVVIKVCLSQSQHLEPEIKHQFVHFLEVVIGVRKKFGKKIWKADLFLEKHLFNNFPPKRKKTGKDIPLRPCGIGYLLYMFEAQLPNKIATRKDGIKHKLPYHLLNW